MHVTGIQDLLAGLIALAAAAWLAVRWWRGRRQSACERCRSCAGVAGMGRGAPRGTVAPSGGSVLITRIEPLAPREIRPGVK